MGVIIRINIPRVDIFQLMRVMIKCCDISNEVRPYGVSDPWVDCLLEEYFIQVSINFIVRK